MVSLRFKHIGVVVHDIRQAVMEYKQIFGYEVLSGPFKDPIQNVSVCFIGKNSSVDPTLELVAPDSADSPVSAFLARGMSAYHLCFEVDSMAEAIKYLLSMGCMLIRTPVPAAAFENRRIAWFYTPSRLLVELVEEKAQ